MTEWRTSLVSMFCQDSESSNTEIQPFPDSCHIWVRNLCATDQANYFTALIVVRILWQEGSDGATALTACGCCSVLFLKDEASSWLEARVLTACGLLESLWEVFLLTAAVAPFRSLPSLPGPFPAVLLLLWSRCVDPPAATLSPSTAFIWTTDPCCASSSCHREQNYNFKLQAWWGHCAPSTAVTKWRFWERNSR